MRRSQAEMETERKTTPREDRGRKDSGRDRRREKKENRPMEWQEECKSSAF